MSADTASYLVLCKHTGENAPTPKTPVAEWRGQVDLDERVTVCRYWDDNGLTTVNLWEVRRVTLPAWLSLDEWLGNDVAWKYLWGFDADPAWPEAWQRGLLGFGSVRKLACVKLLRTKKFRSNFRASLCRQLVSWLETAPEERRYGSPFSPRQWECLLNRWICREGENTATRLYRNRFCPGELVSHEEAAAAVREAA